MQLSPEDRRLLLIMGGVVLGAVLLGAIWVAVQPRLAPGSAPVVATAPPRTPTPSPAAGLWRYEGVVTDADGRPVPAVCVAIGPNGCRRTSPQTDERGVWFFDFPPVQVIYDLHFERVGFKTVDRRIRPSGSAVLNVILERQ